MEATPVRVLRAVVHEKSLAFRISRMFSKWFSWRMWEELTLTTESPRWSDPTTGATPLEDLADCSGTTDARVWTLPRLDCEPERTCNAFWSMLSADTCPS